MPEHDGFRQMQRLLFNVLTLVGGVVAAAGFLFGLVITALNGELLYCGWQPTRALSGIVRRDGDGAFGGAGAQGA